MVKVTHFQIGGKMVKVVAPPETLPPPYGKILRTTEGATKSFGIGPSVAATGLGGWAMQPSATPI